MSCSEGDIILIREFITGDGQKLGQHSFVVINTLGGEIKGLSYDFACNIMSSIKGQAHKEEVLKHPENFTVEVGDSCVDYGNDKEGYIKANHQCIYIRYCNGLLNILYTWSLSGNIKKS